MNGYAVAMFRLIAITASTQIVGNNTVIIRQVIGEGLETECVGGYTSYTDNWSSVLAPLDIVKSEVSGRDKFIQHRFHWHTRLLVVEISAISLLSP